MSQSVRIVKLSDIRENPVALRAVDRESEEFVGLRDSIAKSGVLNAISLRERTSEVDGEVISYYEVCDGLHRYTASIDAGLEEIPALIVDLDDAETLEAQLMTNVHKVETRPVEYTKQLQRIFGANPTLTMADMAAKLCKSAAWVSQRLGLLKLDDGVAALVDDNRITVSNAVALAKLPHEEQVNFVDQAMTMGSEEFVPTVTARVKEINKAKREGREPGEVVFTAVARLQKMAALKDELENRSIGGQLCAQNNVTTAADAFNLGIAWALQLDPGSVEVQRSKAEEKAAALAEAKLKRKKERADKKAKEAAAAAAALQG